MAKNIDNIKIYGDETSAVLWAPKGAVTLLPQNLDDQIDAALQDVGWITEDGTSIGISVDTAEIKAWQGGTAVMFPVTGSSKTIKFTAMEDTPLVAKLQLGASDPIAAGAGAARVNLPGGIPAIEGVAIVKAVSADIVKYIVAPLTSVTDRGDMAFTRKDPTQAELTLAIRGDAYVITNHPAYVEAVKANTGG